MNPGVATEVDLTPLISEARTRPELNVLSVEVQNNAGPGSLIGSLYTIDKRSGSNYEIPLRDSGPLRNMAGLYPWKISDDFQTVIYITNISDQPAEFVAEATYEGGRYTLSPHKLQSGETSVFDLEKIRREQIPDSAGKALPESASLGQFKWAIRGITHGKTALIGRAQMVSRERRISSSYSCHPDCGPNYSDEIDPYSCELEVGQSCQVTVWETANFIDGQTIGPYAAESQWSLTEQIATVDPAVGGTTTVTATSGGGAGLDALLPWQQIYGFDGYTCMELYSYQPSFSAGISVATSIQKLQYAGESGNVDISDTLYVLKGTTVTFNAVPSPANAQFASGKPVWSGSSGASGSGQTKQVTFDSASTSATDYKTVVATAGNAKTANVIVIELAGTLTPDDPFTGRSQTSFGIHERLGLSCSITPSGISTSQIGGAEWIQVAGNGTINTQADGTGTYRVSDSPESATLKLTMLDGPSKGSGVSTNITIVAPSGGYVQKFSGVRHFQNWWSCGFLGDIFITPADVSFANLWFVNRT